MRKTQDAKEQILLQRAVARKIIRSTNILRSDEDNDWPETLLEYRSRNIFLPLARNRISLNTLIKSRLT